MRLVRTSGWERGPIWKALAAIQSWCMWATMAVLGLGMTVDLKTTVDVEFAVPHIFNED